MVSQQLEISSWFAVNQYVSLSWETWLNLDSLVRRAISIEAEQLANMRQQASRDQNEKLEALMAKENAAIKFPSPTGSSINRLLY